MSDRTFKDLMLDKDFMKELINQPTTDDAKKLFENEGQSMSDSEMETLRLLLQKAMSNSEITEEDLVKIVGAGKMEAKVVGGIIGAVLGACTVSPVAAKCGYHVGQAGGTAVGLYYR